MDERITLFFRYMGIFLNSILQFSISLAILFNEIFVVQEGGGIQNLGTLSDMYNYGTLISSSLFDMIHVVMGKTKMYKNYYN